jgi:HPt (histidine-containing phosphotransfer) domain-containing protein
MIRQNHAGSAREIRAAIQQGDIGLAHRLAHSLKGVAGTIGANQLQENAKRLELALAGGQAAQYEGYLAQVEAALASLMDFLESQAVL